MNMRYPSATEVATETCFRGARERPKGISRFMREGEQEAKEYIGRI